MLGVVRGKRRFHSFGRRFCSGTFVIIRKYLGWVLVDDGDRGLGLVYVFAAYRACCVSAQISVLPSARHFW